MSSYKAKDIEIALSKKGFRIHNSHHKLYRYYDGEEKTGIHTFISHGIKEYGDCLLTKMRKQLQLSKEEFADLIECPMKEEKLHEIYSERELI